MLLSRVSCCSLAHSYAHIPRHTVPLIGIKHTFQSPVFAMKAPDNHQYAGASNNYDGYLVNRYVTHLIISITLLS